MVWDTVDEGFLLFGGLGNGPVAGIEPFWDFRNDLHLRAFGGFSKLVYLTGVRIIYIHIYIDLYIGICYLWVPPLWVQS